MKHIFLFFSALILFLTFDVAQTFASHLCGTDCNQFTDASMQSCSHGCNVPGAAPNPDYHPDQTEFNTSAEEQQAQIANNSQEIIEQAIANGASEATAVSVVASYIGQESAQAALDAINEQNTNSANVVTGCQGAGCCLGAWNCSADQYCAGADPGADQYGVCVTGGNEDRTGEEIAAAYIAASPDQEVAAQNVINNPDAFLGQGDTGNTNDALLAIQNVGQQALAQQNGTQIASNENSETLPDDINCEINPSACGDACETAGGDSLVCGNCSTGICFCGKEGISNGLTCNDQILLYGGTTAVGGFAITGSCNNCNQSTNTVIEGNIAQLPSGTPCYQDMSGSQCNYYIGGVNDAPFINFDGNCFSFAEGYSGILGGWYCEGVDNATNVNGLTGCQGSSAQQLPVQNGQVCVSQVSDACGVIQIDANTSDVSNVDAYQTAGTVSYNVFTTAGCTETVTTTTNINIPPIPPYVPPTGSTPPPSEPPQSPPPPGSPVCVGLTSSISAPTLGSAPVFTCTPAQLATRYEFRWRLGSGTFQTLAPSTANSNVSSPLTVNASGSHVVQCRPCNANGCANWNSLGATGQMCGGIAGILCPTGYSCQMGGTHPDASGVCVAN